MSTRLGERKEPAESHAPTRVQRLRLTLMERQNTNRWSLHRARLFTSAYKEAEGQPIVVRRAMAFKKVLEELPISIEEDELLVGHTAAEPLARELYPDMAANWFLEALDSNNLDQAVDEKNVSIDNTAELREICEYWKDRCYQSVYFRLIGEENVKWLRDTGNVEGAVLDTTHSISEVDRLLVLPDYEKVLRKGLKGIINEVKEELETVPLHIGDMESLQKVYFLRALIIVYEAAIGYSRRYAAEARRLADKAVGQRKQELRKIAELCDRVPENPARSFYEALQAVWIVFTIMFLESNPIGVVPGRFDQYMYPFYKHDIEEGKITREEALELLECFRIKASSTRKSRSRALHQQASGEQQYHTLTLGGLTAEGKDATNELSYLVLEAAIGTRTPHQNICIRLHDKTPEDFAVKGLELAKTGQGFPAFFNDEAAIRYFVDEAGVPLEVARNYAIAGCVQALLPGISGSQHGYVHNSSKFFELALHNGIDPVSGKQFGPRVGDFVDFHSYDDVVRAFEEQERYLMQKGADLVVAGQVVRGEVIPPLFASGLVDDCIKRGKSIHSGGARIEFPVQVPNGMINVANSLAAIKKRVFEEGSIGKRELLDALAANFEGKEEIRKLLLTAPKYGNDDDYVDEIARDLYKSWAGIGKETGGFYGQKCRLSPYSITRFYPMGQAVSALPDGRLAKEPLADGSVSSFRGTDTNGPTALMNSAVKIDQSPFQGTLLNMKFHPSALKTEEDLSKVLALIRTYFSCGGRHIQFNVIDKQTLVDAQLHPETHRDLIIRVAGYSAFFTDLNKGVQDDIIGRTEYQMA